jgi:hypothetical protein
MLTEFGGAPVDGGTIPALIFADVVNSYLSLESVREAGEEPETTDPTVTPAPTDTSVAPAPTEDTSSAAEETTEPATDEAPAESAAPPADAAPAPAPTGGGVSPG